VKPVPNMAAVIFVALLVGFLAGLAAGYLLS